MNENTFIMINLAYLFLGFGGLFLLEFLAQWLSIKLKGTHVIAYCLILAGLSIILSNWLYALWGCTCQS